LLYALGGDALNPAERDELRVHLAGGCPACAGALAEAYATVASLPLSLDPVAPPPAVRDQLMRRVLSTRSQPMTGTSSAPESDSTRSSSSRLWQAISAVAALVAVALGVMYYRAAYGSGKDSRINMVLQQLAESESRIDALKHDLEQASIARELVHAPQLQLATLQRQEPQPKAHGRVLWDRTNDKWLVTVHDMTPPPPGRYYELWFISKEGKPVGAGLIDLDQNGNGSLVVHVPAEAGTVAQAAITDEPSLVQAPTGKMHLLGSVQ
jgi:anti-sigma-K factor RskA